MAPAHRPSRLALLVLVLVTACVRLVGVDFLLPQWREPDSQLVQHLRLERRGQADEESGFSDAYPYVLPYLIKLVPAGEHAPPQTLEQHLEAVSRIYVETRTFIALLSVLVVPLVFLLARRFVSEPWALFAATLSATSLLAQWFAQEARPHAAATAAFLLGVVAAVRLRHTPTWSWYALAGGAAALAVGSLHSGFAVLFAGLVAHILRAGPRARREHLKLLVPVAIVAVGVLLFYPFFFPWLGIADAAKLESAGDEVQFGRHRISLESFTFQGARIVARTLWYYDPVATALALLAIALWATRRWWAERVPGAESGRDLAVVLAHATPYFLLLAAFDDTYERFVLPLVPYVSILAAWGAARVVALARGPWRKPALGLALAALVLQSAGCLRLAWLRRAPDTMELAAAYVSEHASPERDKLIVSPTLELPLARSDESLFREGGRKISFSRWTKYQAHRRDDPLPPPHWNMDFVAASRQLGYRTADSIADDPEGFLRALGSGIYVFNAGALRGHAAERRVYDALRAKGTFLARFAPNDSGEWGEIGLEFQDPLYPTFPAVFPRVLVANAIGPVVELYRVE